MTTSILTANGTDFATPFSSSDLQIKMKQLQISIRYTFKDPLLLHQALTRQNAIQEKHPYAFKQNFEILEFIGDAALKHGVAQLLYSKYGYKTNEAELHTETKRLIANDGVMPKIARNLKLDELIIKGKGEQQLSSNILSDSVEALLGAISVDCEDKQELLFNVIERLWQPYLNENRILSSLSNSSALSSSTVQSPSISTTLKSLSVATSNSPFSLVLNQALSTPVSLSANYQSLICGIGPGTSIGKFQQFLTKVDDVNCRSKGKNGNTPLIMLLNKPKLQKENELPKIKALLDKGAKWETTNNKGESANTFAIRKHGGRETVLKMIREL